MCHLARRFRTFSVLLAVVTLASGCRTSQADGPPGITFSQVPPAGSGGSDALGTIAGRVNGARPGQRLVVYAYAGVWWVQPFVAQPYTAIDANSTWKSQTHLGARYAALLVDPSYQPAATIANLPRPGDRGVIAVETVDGTGPPPPQRPARQLTFSGYTWEAREAPSNRGGNNEYRGDNVWVDREGLLHLRITRRENQWYSAEVKLTRSLGYGTYAFVARDITGLDPASTFSMFTWDDLGAEQNHRGIDVEIGQWGVAANKNAQYLIQPYYVPANVFRFAAPAGRLTHMFRWQPGRVSFSTLRTPATSGGRPAPALASHDFLAGVPAPGGETVRINLYVFRDAPVPIQRETEVVLEKFEYLP
jgi:hypothetical protein